MLSKSDYKHFEKAKKIAHVSDFYKVHIGCVAVYQNSIIGVGCNTKKTHPIQKYYNRFRNSWDDNEINPSLHAEN